MKYAALSATAALLLSISGYSAEACNPLLSKNYGKHVIPTAPASMLARNNAKAPSRASIVGLWHVVHTTSDGGLFAEAFDMWHSDGTEEELINGPPAAGPICLGVWTQTGNSIQLQTHVTWLYDLNNNFVGTLDLTETNEVKRDPNKYGGTFNAKFYDPNGNQFMEITGTTKAERLNGG